MVRTLPASCCGWRRLDTSRAEQDVAWGQVLFGTPTLVLGHGQVVFVKLDSVPASDRDRPLWEAVGNLAGSGQALRQWQRVTPPSETG